MKKSDIKVKPVEASEEVIEKNEKKEESTNIPKIIGILEDIHVRACKIDVKELWNETWRVNVYEEEKLHEDDVIRKLTLPHSYFVKLTADKKLLFNPDLKRKDTSIVA